jgi:hypothetical protein
MHHRDDKDYDDRNIFFLYWARAMKAFLGLTSIKAFLKPSTDDNRKFPAWLIREIGVIYDDRVLSDFGISYWEGSWKTIHTSAYQENIPIR